MLSKLCIGRIIMVFLFLSTLSMLVRVCRTHARRGSYLWKRASVDGRQVQLQCNTKHASSLVAAELITDGCIDGTVNTRLWIAAVLSRRFRVREQVALLFKGWLDDSSCILYQIAYHFSLIRSRDCCYEQDIWGFDFQHLFQLRPSLQFNLTLDSIILRLWWR